MAKGWRKFERDVSRALSRWWTFGERDDVFWRDPVRGRTPKKGQKTFGQYGDILATDEVGHKLTNLAIIECKTGYKTQNPFDGLDKKPVFGKKTFTQWEDFIFKAESDAEANGSPYWLLIFKRSRRDTMIYFPHRFAERVERDLIDCEVVAMIRTAHYCVWAMPFADFLDRVSPFLVEHGKTRQVQVERIYR